MKRNPMFLRSLLMVTAVALLSSSFAKAQMLWPIAGAKAGEGILYQPQEYIDGELVFSDLFIQAPEGTPVLAPADGTLEVFVLGTYYSLTYGISMGADADNFDEMKRQLEEAGALDDIPVPSRYVTGSIGIRLEDGSKIWLSGLMGDVPLKTGMKVRRGDTLGTVSYRYHKIDVPHIDYSMSNRKGQPIDPMTPFGLKSSFIAPGELVIPDTLTEEQAVRDLEILLEAYRQCYPSIDEVVTPEQMQAFEAEAMAAVKGGISYADFYDIVRSSVSSRLLHDSHMAPITPNPHLDDPGKIHLPNIIPGIVNGKLFVKQATEKYREHLGKGILSIDGQTSGELSRKVYETTLLFDGKNRSIPDLAQLDAWNYIFDNRIDHARTSVIVLDDSTVIEDRWMPQSARRSYLPVRSEEVNYVARLMDARSDKFSFRPLSDSVTLFSLHSFTFNDVETDALTDSLRAHIYAPYMIIDVRNNPGGDITFMCRLLTCFLNRPAEILDSYEMVSDTLFPILKYSMNYDGEHSIFSGFTPREGRKGLYAKHPWLDYSRIIPDSLLNFKGRLYVLTDETSVSAATLFPALLVRNYRAVTVGRETGSGYHSMTAMTTAKLRLPNSYIMVSIPMERSVLEELVTPRTPQGRGLLPDYEVPLTYEELYVSATDPVLERALELISQGQYLGDNPFPVSEDNAKGRAVIWLGCGVALVGLILLLVFRRRRR